MNKLARYLNQHLVGEVVVDQAVLSHFSTDNSPLTIQPEMVAYARNTNDIRKLLRFAWQLAEKGHILSVTPRGSGLDATGGAIGSGLIISLTTHMNKLQEFDPKQRLIRLQPGVTVASLQDALLMHGLKVSALQDADRMATIGGSIGAARDDVYNSDWIDQIEVVLANGDLLQTKRLSKRELNKKKGEEGFEADIYREIDGLIEENKELIAQLDPKDATGYSAIANVKKKDGSIDLTPLFFASQGTLGVISEMILRADSINDGESVVVAVFDDSAKARDAVDSIEKLDPYTVEYYDELMIQRAQDTGKTFPFLAELKSTPKAALVIRLDDQSARARAKKVKKLTKVFEQFEAVVSSTDNLDESELASLVSLPTLAIQAEARDEAAIPILDGVYVPRERFEEFADGVLELASKRRVVLPLYGKPLDGLWYVRPILNLKTVGGKQAVFKLIDEVNQLVVKCGGHLAGIYGEGRTQSYSTHKSIDEDMRKLYKDIKAIFDPYGVLNNGVKQSAELKVTVAQLRNEYKSNHTDALARF